MLFSFQKCKISVHRLNRYSITGYLKNTYYLPDLSVLLGCKLFIPVDLEFTEERGLFPDLWVSTEYALDYTVAALDNGTITTQEPPLEELIPEKPDAGCTTVYLATIILICCLLYRP